MSRGKKTTVADIRSQKAEQALKVKSLRDQYNQLLKAFKAEQRIDKKKQLLTEIVSTLKDIEHSDKDKDKNVMVQQWGAVINYYREVGELKTAIELCRSVLKDYDDNWRLKYIYAYFSFLNQDFQTALKYAQDIKKNEREVRKLKPLEMSISPTELLLSAKALVVLCENALEKEDWLENIKDIEELLEQYNEKQIAKVEPAFYNYAVNLRNVYNFLVFIDKKDIGRAIESLKERPCYTTQTLSSLGSLVMSREIEDFGFVIEYLKAAATSDIVFSESVKITAYHLRAELQSNPDHPELLDLNSAEICFNVAIRLGSGRAAHDLAYKLYHGEGFKENLEKSFEHYQKAVDLGHPMSLLPLSEFYIRGLAGVKVDLVQALHLLTRYQTEYVDQPHESNLEDQACHMVSKRLIAFCYFNQYHESKQKDLFIKSRDLMTEAAEGGDAAACLNASRSWSTFSEFGVDLEKALYFAEKAYDLGFVDAFEDIYQLLSLRLSERFDHHGIGSVTQKLHQWVRRAALDGHPLAIEIERNEDVDKTLKGHIDARRTVTSTAKQFFILSNNKKQPTIVRVNTLLSYEITHVYERIMLIKNLVIILAKHDPKRHLVDAHIGVILKHCQQSFEENCCTSDFYVTNLLNSLCQLYVLTKIENLAQIEKYIEILLVQVQERQSMTCYSWGLIFSALVKGSMVVNNMAIIEKGIQRIADQMTQGVSSRDATDLIHQLALCHFALKIRNKKQLIGNDLILQLVERVNLTDMNIDDIHSLMLGLHYFYNHNPAVFSSSTYTNLMSQCVIKLTQWQSEFGLSQAQDEITKMLRQKLGEKAVEAEVLFNGLSVDIYLPKYHLVIQVQGATHFIRSSEETTLKDLWHENIIKAQTDWSLKTVKPPHVIVVSGWDVQATPKIKQDRMKQLVSQIDGVNVSVTSMSSNLWSGSTTKSSDLVPATTTEFSQ